MIDITKTTIPTAEQVEAFKTAWAKADAAGLEGLRTIAGLHAALNIETPEPKPEVYAIDEDEDRWEPVPNTDLWHCTAPGCEYLEDLTTERLEERFGPVTFYGLD
ncbi:hypothetical protein QDW26_gp61 [Microbacterium phage Didgeridoo]|uniref:hypothetical protein n=1 Tax=Microbacterium phage Didgeridoo TaxID=2126928 RepID=UPI000D22A945|nr:hypothetical protein QDW26_gp61 [Microbacterium phage Didgeridoo]AVR56727.1 hypothetical protein PBI_DIDGERIDOO_62 [Microbacterium phage Didgeridoo]